MLNQPLGDFPHWVYFMRDSPDFLETKKDEDRLGGTLSHLESELRPQMLEYRNSKLTIPQKKTLNFVIVLIDIF